MGEPRWDIHEYNAVESTNDAAKELVADGAGHGTVVVAKTQVAGKGRHGRRWASPRGGLYVSLVVEPAEMSVQLLSLFTGIVVVRTLRRFKTIPGLHWPNDVYVEDRKIGGILCEGIYRQKTFRVVAGIGINNDFTVSALPREIRDEATTLRDETGKSVPNEELLEVLLGEYDAMLEILATEGGVDQLLARYRRACLTIGRKVVVQTERRLEGEVTGVTSDGYLVLKTPSGETEEIPEGWLERVYWS